VVEPLLVHRHYRAARRATSIRGGDVPVPNVVTKVHRFKRYRRTSLRAAAR
jgi:hypothetical protein